MVDKVINIEVAVQQKAVQSATAFATQGEKGDSGLPLTWISLIQTDFDALPQSEKDDSTIMYNIIPPIELIFSVKTDNTGVSNDDQFTVPATGGPYSISWSDGSEDTGLSGTFTKTFAGGADTYIGKMTSDDSTPFKPFQLSGADDPLKLILISQWGSSIEWTTAVNAFRTTTKLEVSATDFPDFSNVTSVAFMFFASTGLTSLSMQGWPLQNVTTFSDFLRGASSLTSLTGLSGLNVSKVTTFFFAFRQIKVTSLDLSGWNTEKVTNMAGMFLGTNTLTDIIGLEDLNYSLVTTMAVFLSGVTLPTSRYSDLLINIEANPHKPNVTLDGGGSKYSVGAATTARAALVSDGWTITDGGQE